VSDNLIEPHAGVLVDAMADGPRAQELKDASRDWPSWDLSPRQLCDLELLLTGAFSPLPGFMRRLDYEPVCDRMRLADGTLWPMPIVLDVGEELAGRLESGKRLALRDPEGVMLAALEVEDVWRPDLRAEASRVFGTEDPAHPAVRELQTRPASCYVGGKLEGVQLPAHYDFRELRLTPAELRQEFARLGWRRVVAFQTRNSMHRAHHELTLRAARSLEANLLIHPVVGLIEPGDLDHYTRVHCYRKVLAHYPRHAVKLALLPLAMRMGGPREALWQAIIRKNYGCTHLLVGRGHASPGNDSAGNPFYGPDDAQELVREHEGELGVGVVPFREMLFSEAEGAHVPDDEVAADARVLSLSDVELRKRLEQGREIPEWFTFPEVAAELQRRHRPRQRQGFTVFLTGLSGAGKSTIANALLVKFLEMGGRPVTLLDGDIVRRNLSSELGFSREHRDINIRRIGFVASEITKNGGIAICAPIAPYDHVRKEVRTMIERVGGFILVHVDAPVEVCEQRDRKGLYAKARAGIIKEFTGISDPYETPDDADVSVLTTDLTPEQAAQEVLLHLEGEGYVGVNGAADVT
jgi:sulfate adenylyltransferase